VHFTARNGLSRCVSIPHREATNIFVQDVSSILFTVSIPHREATNDSLYGESLPKKTCFNPS